MTAMATTPRRRTPFELHRNRRIPLVAVHPTAAPAPEPAEAPITEPVAANPAPTAGSGLSADFEERRAEAISAVESLFFYGDSARTATRAAHQPANL